MLVDLLSEIVTANGSHQKLIKILEERVIETRAFRMQSGLRGHECGF